MPKKHSTDSEPAQKLRTALALMEEGMALKLQKLRREFPHDTDEQLNERLRAWQRDQPPPRGCVKGRWEDVDLG